MRQTAWNNRNWDKQLETIEIDTKQLDTIGFDTKQLYTIGTDTKQVDTIKFATEQPDTIEFDTKQYHMVLPASFGANFMFQYYTKNWKYNKIIQ